MSRAHQEKHPDDIVVVSNLQGAVFFPPSIMSYNTSITGLSWCLDGALHSLLQWRLVLSDSWTWGEVKFIIAAFDFHRSSFYSFYSIKLSALLVLWLLFQIWRITRLRLTGSSNRPWTKESRSVLTWFSLHSLNNFLKPSSVFSACSSCCDWLFTRLCELLAPLTPLAYCKRTIQKQSHFGWPNLILHWPFRDHLLSKLTYGSFIHIAYDSNPDHVPPSPSPFLFRCDITKHWSHPNCCSWHVKCLVDEKGKAEVQLFFFYCGNQFQFFLKKTFNKRFLPVCITKLPSGPTSQTPSRPQELNQQSPQDQRDQLVPLRQIYCHSNHVSSPYSGEVEVQHENAISTPIQLLRWN